MIEDQPAAATAFQWKTVEQGAATSVWAGFVAASEEIGGNYCEHCHVAEVNEDATAGHGVRAYALDPERAKSSWSKSEEMVDEQFQSMFAMDT